jgi:hypothetical protein
MAACMFCDNDANSAEHLFPDWINRAFTVAGPEPLTIQKQVTGMADEQWDVRKLASIKIPGICRTCNNEWMSVIENNAKPLILPMITGTRVSLNPAEQLQLATWTTLKAFVFDLGGALQSVVARDHCVLLRHLHRPPATMRAYLAVYGPGNNFHAQRHFIIGQRRPGDAHLESASVTTFVLGKLVLQVLYSAISTSRPLATLGEITKTFQTLIPPVRTPPQWPATTPLDETTLGDFIEERIEVRNVEPPSAFPGGSTITPS